MADANELYQTIMRELSDVVISDSGDFTEEQDELTFHQETDSDDFPPSLLSYFETSKSRAADCEKFILEGPQDLTASHHTEDLINLPYNLDEDLMKLNMQVTCETENEENDSSADTHLLPTPTETEALSAHNVSACPSSDDDTEADGYMGCEEYLEPAERILKSSMKEEKMKKNSEHQREHREKQQCEEMMKEEQRRQRERDFQEELRKIMETERLQQKELELMQKRAQEKLEQEFMLQQEMISNLQKRVEEERKMREEEQKRIKEEGERKRKEEEEKRKREEEMMKREMERKRVEEEKRKREEDEKRKREDEMIRREMERKRVEEENRKMKEEREKRKLEEMRIKEKRKKKEEKMRMEEEEKNKIEEDMKKREEERKIKEIRLKEERRRHVEEEERKRRENDAKVREMERNRETEEKEEETRKKEEEKQMKELTRKKLEGDEREENDEEMGLKAEGTDNDDKDRRREEEERTEQEEMRSKEEERKCEEETREAEVEKRRREEEHREIEEIKLKDEEEKIKQNEEMRHGTEGRDMLKKKKENKIKEEEMGQKKEEEGECSDMEKEKCPRKEREWNKAHETENRKTQREGKTKDEENRQEEVKKTEDVREIKEENIRTEERRLRGGGEEEGHKIIVRDIEEGKEEEEKERVMRANELQENKKKRETEMKTHNESKNTETSRNSLTSQPEDGSTLSSPSPGPLHSESTSASTCSDLNQNTNQTSTCKTVHRQHGAVQHFTSSSSLPVCLPERTEQKRLSWMKDCVPWSKLSLQNRRKQKGGVRSGRGAGRRRGAEARGLPPLCPHTLLQSTGCTSLQEVTTVTLEDLPGCSLSTLAQCPHLQALSLRHCGLKSLDGIKHLAQLCYIDVQENNISFVDCENMTSLQVLLLGRNKLTSIHGLTGAENLDLLDLSHNSITRIAGLESMKRLQRLSVDHNQLISTKGLREVYTLLHLDCSHNHLASVEGLENSALLQTLDLRANSLTEPPTLNNHILLRELHLDDNSISSLQSLAGCWLPLLHHLSVPHNRITLLPSMADFVSLTNLDLQFNCMSELQNVCESLEGCGFIGEVHLSGNPVEQESGWSSTLQQAVAGLRATDGQETDAFMSAPAVPRVSPASGGFLAFCQAQLKQTRDLQQQHSRELSNASSHLDAVKSSCRHLAETLKLAVDQRFAHEYGDTTESAGQTTPEETLEVDSNNAEESAENVTLDVLTSEEKSSSAESLRDADAATTTAATPVFKHRDLDPKNTAAVVIQQWWRKYRQKCGNVSSPPAAERGGGDKGGEPDSGPSSVNNRAATIIQAFWRGFALRRRLASALAAVTRPDGGEEEETFGEVDVDEFVLDEAALEKHWTLDSPSRLGQSRSEELLSLKRHRFLNTSHTPLEPFPESSQCTLPPLPVWRPKQAWVTGEPVESTGQRISPESSNRNNSPASMSALSGLSARSEKILEEWGFTDSHTAQLMLKRAQKMKSKKQQQKKFRDPSVHLALFRNCSYQRGPAEARNRPVPHGRYHMKVSEAEPGPGLWQDEETEHVTQQRRAQQSDRESESERFLPEISSDILNGGRVQLVADPGYTERLHHASGSWANSNLAALPCKERNYPRRNSLGHARAEERPPPNRVTSAPLKKERISFRDNPVRLSGGWGGGKKRDRVYK